jgi:hypothetical protein
MTVMSQQLPMLTSRCSSNGGTSLHTIARGSAGVPAARITLGADLLKTRTAGHVAGGVSLVAAQLPWTVLNPEQIQVQGPRGSYATKPESMQKQKFDGLRGVPPRGRPV